VQDKIFKIKKNPNYMKYKKENENENNKNDDSCANFNKIESEVALA
jgi:hypothetical protein